MTFWEWFMDGGWGLVAYLVFLAVLVATDPGPAER
jgi:hypothetical protein